MCTRRHIMKYDSHGSSFLLKRILRSLIGQWVSIRCLKREHQRLIHLPEGEWAFLTVALKVELQAGFSLTYYLVFWGIQAWSQTPGCRWWSLSNSCQEILRSRAESVWNTLMGKTREKNRQGIEKKKQKMWYFLLTSIQRGKKVFFYVQCSS